MARMKKSKKGENNKKSLSGRRKAVKTACLTIGLAVFCYLFANIQVGYSAQWTDPTDTLLPPISDVSQSPINIGPQTQEKTGLLIVNGLDTDNRIDITGSGSLLITDPGNAYVENDLLISDILRVNVDVEPGVDNVLINTDSADNSKELQIGGRTYFYTYDEPNPTVTVITSADAPAFISQSYGYSWGLYVRSYSSWGGATAKGIAGNATGVGTNTFGVFGLAGERISPPDGIPYAGYFQGMTRFAEDAGSANQPFYLNSDVLVENLNVDHVVAADGTTYDSDDFILKGEVAAAFIVAQAADSQPQPGSLNLSGLAQFDQGVSTNGMQVDTITADQSVSVSGSIGVQSAAGQGEGNNLAAAFYGPVWLEGGQSPLILNSPSKISNLNVEKLNGYLDSDFLKYDDLNVNNLDQALVRLQQSSPGYSQTGSLDINGQLSLGGSFLASQFSINQSGQDSPALSIAGADLPGSYALFAESVGADSWAGYFNGSVKVTDHDLFVEEYLEITDRNIAGQSTIPAGELSVDIQSDQYDLNTSLILVSPGPASQIVNLVVSKNKEDFSVSRFSPGQQTDFAVEFSYLLINLL